MCACVMYNAFIKPIAYLTEYTIEYFKRYCRGVDPMGCDADDRYSCVRLDHDPRYLVHFKPNCDSAHAYGVEVRAG